LAAAPSRARQMLATGPQDERMLEETLNGIRTGGDILVSNAGL
jgi:hypothetical protein